MPNGNIIAYNVWYNQTLNCSGSLVSFSDSVIDSVLAFNFTRLEEDTSYEFYVSAVTNAGEGVAAMGRNRTLEDGVCVCVRACVCVCVHACMRACMRVCIFCLFNCVFQARIVLTHPHPLAVAAGL